MHDDAFVDLAAEVEPRLRRALVACASSGRDEAARDRRQRSQSPKGLRRHATARCHRGAEPTNPIASSSRVAAMRRGSGSSTSCRCTVPGVGTSPANASGTSTASPASTPLVIRTSCGRVNEVSDFTWVRVKAVDGGSQVEATKPLAERVIGRDRGGIRDDVRRHGGHNAKQLKQIAARGTLEGW